MTRGEIDALLADLCGLAKHGESPTPGEMDTVIAAFRELQAERDAFMKEANAAHREIHRLQRRAGCTFPKCDCGYETTGNVCRVTTARETA